MIRINLLPHRAEKRRARKIQFIALSLISLIAGALLMGFVHVVMDAKVSYQDRRNDYLKHEISILDKQIEEIKKLREQTESLLARKNVVERLQSTRADVVHLMDQMLRILPDGVYISTLRQTGNHITMVGFAQSNARVSTLYRAIEDSPWLDTPVIVDTHAISNQNGRMNEFTMTFNLTKDAAKPADKKG